MTIPPHFGPTFRVFSAKRVGYLLAAVSFAFVPAHFYISCRMSGLVGIFSLVLLIITAGLSFLTPRGAQHRLRPMALTFIAVIAHMLCTH